MKKLLLTLGIILVSLGPLAAGEIDIVLNTASGDIYGSILTPENDAKDIIVLFISGSGPTDRNGNNIQMLNNSIKFLAEELCGAGIPSVRYDKRGIAASVAVGQKEEDMRFAVYVDDARDWIELLAKEYRRIVIIGHSEGAQIGLMAAIDNPKVTAVVTVAGIGRKPSDVIREQLGKQSQQLLDMSEPIIKSLEEGVTVDDTPPILAALFRPSVQPYLVSWFGTNPADAISKLNIPVFIVQGDMDIQVPVEDAELLAKAQPKARKIIIAGMNHVFKECATTDQMAQLSTYMDPNLPNVPLLGAEIIGYIKEL
ncbi:MAG: alpha/beta hydrolase [Bacteroidales bacterium]|nr:alpha/beta hydrolase [Bacteroidales bacterium]MCL2133573.1 alpha/beta hydrolase [Bacteroidales bacterium]